MVDGLGRWLALPRIPGFNDIAQVSYAIVIASCFPSLLLRDQNIVIRFLGRGIKGRTNYALEVFGNLMTLAFFAILVWQFYLILGFTGEQSRVAYNWLWLRGGGLSRSL